MGAFLGKLKKDLCIGVDGYPKYVIIGEQTYSIMKNLKVKYYSDHYDWMYPVHWHLMKTAAEVIKYVLQDGGFKQFHFQGNVVIRGTYHSGKTFIMYL